MGRPARHLHRHPAESHHGPSIPRPAPPRSSSRTPRGATGWRSMLPAGCTPARTPVGGSSGTSRTAAARRPPKRIKGGASTVPTTWPSTATAASGSAILATATIGPTWSWTTSRCTWQHQQMQPGSQPRMRPAAMATGWSGRPSTPPAPTASCSMPPRPRCSWPSPRGHPKAGGSCGPTRSAATSASASPR